MRQFNKLLAFTMLSLLSFKATAGICFISKRYNEQKICYTTDPDKDFTAKQYFIKFTKNLSNPGRLVSLQGEMKQRYSLAQFHKSLIKYYSHITPESIEQVISQGDWSAVFLKTGEIMYFNHTISAFVFDFDSPMIFVGANKFYRKGSKLIKQNVPVKKSNCNLQKGGVVFLSPDKESLFYKKNSTFCTYANFYFEKSGDNITVKPVSSIGNDHYSISGLDIEFSRFLKWLQMP